MVIVVLFRLAVKTRIQDLEDGVSDLHENADKTHEWEAMEALKKTVKESLVAVSTKYSNRILNYKELS